MSASVFLMTILGLLRLDGALLPNARAVALLKEMNVRPDYLSIVCLDHNTDAPQGSTNAGRFTFLQAYIHLRNGQCENAISSWESVIHEDSSHKVATYMLGVLYFKKGETYKALDTFENLSLRERRYVRETIARYFSTTATYSQKLEQLELAFWIHPSRPAVRRLQKHLSEAGRIAEVDFYYHELERIADQDTFDYWWARGQRALRDQQWELAVEAFVSGLSYAADEQESYWLLLDAERAFRALGNAYCADVFSALLQDVNSVPNADQRCLSLPAQH
jgi:tetratricopeptide (TPR) repeat protein